MDKTDLDKFQEFCLGARIDCTLEIKNDGYLWAKIIGEIDSTAYIRFHQDGRRALDQDIDYGFKVAKLRKVASA